MLGNMIRSKFLPNFMAAEDDMNFNIANKKITAFKR